MATRETLSAIRFGYGLPVPAPVGDGVDAMLGRLVGPDTMMRKWPVAGKAQYTTITVGLRALKQSGKDKNDAGVIAKREELVQQSQLMLQSAAMATFARAIDSSDGLRERLVTFWADHFSVVAMRKVEGVLPFSMIEDAVRPHLSGSFADMLLAVSLHPAMLIYLDQSSSTGPKSRLGVKQGKGLNENLAREMMELHSLGVGGVYTQTDVTELARLLTGVTVGPTGEMIFDSRKSEPGPKSVLGKVYSAGGLEDVRAALRDLSLHRDTGQHLARKLVVHFVSDQPDSDLVAVVAEAYTRSGGDLMAAYTALLTHPAAWVEVTQKVRQPFDFIVASLRALDVSGADIQAMGYQVFRRLVMNVMAAMGQPFKRPAGPNGIAENAEEWITPQGLAQRITWAMQVPQKLGPLPDPVTLAQTCLADRASEDLLWAAARAEDRAQGVGLVLASAEFNRR